ncbi:MAG: hypothetical protein V4610_08635 [Pseudomonadota bacterium]|uniref:Uncharacterized protein n=1 Tax=hydrothermal vent metagenome TaxID=652676 RepID=A0A160TPI7_9ZZZZ
MQKYMAIPDGLRQISGLINVPKESLMNPVFRVALLAAVASLMPAPLAAEQKNDAGTASKKRDPNQMVCENQEVLGSRLAVKKICMTRSQWAEQRRTDREMVQQSQVSGCGRKVGC